MGKAARIPSGEEKSPGKGFSGDLFFQSPFGRGEAAGEIWFPPAAPPRRGTGRRKCLCNYFHFRPQTGRREFLFVV